MEPVKLSMRGFAEVSSAAPNRKLSILKRFRSPNSDESVGRSNYYVKALSLINRYHRGQTAYVQSALSKLLAEANAAVLPREKAKLLNNYRAVTDYLRHFGTRKLEIKPGKKLHYVFERLVVSAHPDLVAEENGELVLIKLNLGKQNFSGGVSATLLHVLFEAAQIQGLPINSWRVECLQSSSGSRTVGPKKGFGTKQSLDAECKAILALCG